MTTIALAASARMAMAQTATDVSNGIEALARRDVAGAMREFGKASAQGNPAIRSAGEQWMGHVSWAVYGDAKAASTHLARALAQANDSSMVLVERARLEGFQRRYGDAVRTASEAMLRAVDAERRGLAARTLIALAVDGAFAAPASRAGDSIQRSDLAPARDTLAARVARFPGRTTDAQALLYAGLLLRDADAIETGWRSYYALIDDGAADALKVAEETIQRGTARMRDSPASEKAWRDIATGLAESRLYEALGLFTRTGRPPQATASSTLRDASTYGEFLRALRASANDFYRRALIGTVRDGDLDRAINARTRELWSALRWPSAQPPYYPAVVPGELARRFGTVMSLERGAPIPELHLAHVVASFEPAVVMGSPRIRPRQVILDGVAGNGIDAWLLDGAGGRAGWASADSIFELRTAFTEIPFRAWVALADPQSMPGELFRIHRDSVADIERARRDSVGYFPSVAARMFRAGASAILDSLYGEQMSQADRQLAFVRIMYRQLTLTSIDLHESRHVVDARATRRPGADAEFRAKIDEVIGSPRPKLAMTAILSPTIGAKSSHGQANRRIMLGLVRWIRKNGTSIAGYDGSMPALLQLPNLTDAQLIAAFTSMRTAG